MIRSHTEILDEPNLSGLRRSLTEQGDLLLPSTLFTGSGSEMGGWVMVVFLYR
jgi:hypothetical protein